jgi:hypothetical protein
MKFGLESEKFLFDLKHLRPSKGVFRFIDALSDFQKDGDLPNVLITNEFVLNLVEMGTRPSPRPTRVLRDYLLSYHLLNKVAERENVALVPMGALPMRYLPHMTPKWLYQVQNSILSKGLHGSWMLDEASPLLPAGNCAGIHVHAEIETNPEFLFSTRELMDKFNFGLMLSPMIAFASSPYFFYRSGAHSMRAREYFEGVYRDFPLSGALPPVMTSSSEVLNFFRNAQESWLKAGVEAGLALDDIKKLFAQKGANWNPVRWNRVWNTIELRFLDSDRIDYDCAKFIWICAAMRRLDPKGEGLTCELLAPQESLSEKLVEQAFTVNNKKVFILDSDQIAELFKRAIHHGVTDPLVNRYLFGLADFSSSQLSRREAELHTLLTQVLEKGSTTSQLLLSAFGEENLCQSDATSVVERLITEEKNIFPSFINKFPDLAEFFERI